MLFTLVAIEHAVEPEDIPLVGRTFGLYYFNNNIINIDALGNSAYHFKPVRLVIEKHINNTLLPDGASRWRELEALMSPYFEETYVADDPEAFPEEMKRFFEFDSDDEADRFFENGFFISLNPFLPDYQPVVLRVFAERPSDEVTIPKQILCFKAAVRRGGDIYAATKAVFSEHKLSIPAHTFFAINDELEAIGYQPDSLSQQTIEELLIDVYIDQSQIQCQILSNQRLIKKALDRF